MSDLQAIRERHERVDAADTIASADMGNVARAAHSDRATLLAEVDRLRGLCGRPSMGLNGNAELLTYRQMDALIHELRDASK